jgi:hypothetical protein
MLRHILTPADFPRGISFKILGEGNNQRLLRELLAISTPSSTCIGTARTLNEPGETIVVTDPNWRELVATDVSSDVIIFPTPGGELWLYWEFFKTEIHKFRYDEEAGRYYITADDWRDTLLHYQGGRGLALKRGVWSHGWRTPLYMMGLRPHRTLPSGERRYFLGRGKYLDFGVISTGGGYIQKKRFIVQHQKHIDYIRRRLSDQRSQDSFNKIFAREPKLSWEHYLNGLLGSLQYFEYLDVRPGDVILNLGVHTGCEIPLFLAAMSGKGELHNIDPLGD